MVSAVSVLVRSLPFNVTINLKYTVIAAGLKFYFGMPTYPDNPLVAIMS